MSERYWYTYGELFDRQKAHPRESITMSLDAMAALAAKSKKAGGNMIHARELEITAVTTVSDLFELIDLPYRITKKSVLSIVRQSPFPGVEGATSLRLEWRGDDE